MRPPARLSWAAILIRLGRKGLKKLLNMGIYGRQMDESRRQTISQLLINVYEGVAWFLVVVIALSKLNINVNSLLAVAGVGGIAVGFGAQSLVKDTLSGLFIFFENQFVVGDTVDLAGLSGTVEKMTLRVTELRSFEGDLHVIPNGEITLSPTTPAASTGRWWMCRWSMRSAWIRLSRPWKRRCAPARGKLRA